MKNEKKKAAQYLGNRGISEPVKRAAYFEGLWFIVFEYDPSEVEVSFACGIYEPYDFLPSKGFAWTADNLRAIKESIKN